ncbi:MAG: hypothetical protein ACI3V3_04370 [Faecousia sp.]
MNLITENDWSRLARSLLEMREDRVEVTMGCTSIEVCTTRVKKGWPVAMLVGLRIESGNMIQRQYFESVEAARRAYPSLIGKKG